MGTIYAIDTDAFNGAEDLVRAVIALASGAQWDGGRVLRFRGTTLACDIVDGRAYWTINGSDDAPRGWFARFGLRPSQDQRDTVDRVVARVARNTAGRLH